MKAKKIWLVGVVSLMLAVGFGTAEANLPLFGSKSADFSDVPFLHAKPRDVWTYEGQGEFEGTSYQRIFSMENVLGVNCLKMVETGIDEYYVSKGCFEVWCAKDIEGGLWFFKVRDKGVIVFQARNLNELVNFSETPWMEARLMTGEYYVGETVVEEDGGTETIVSIDAGLPDYPDTNFVVIKWMDGDSPDIDWEYHHPEMGYVLNLWDDTGNTSGRGWYLADKSVLWPSKCGDPGTVYLPQDLNQDCYVNLEDFAIFANYWLQCTDPNNTDCDIYWK
jgi:hypothetical protein